MKQHDDDEEKEKVSYEWRAYLIFSVNFRFIKYVASVARTKHTHTLWCEKVIAREEKEYDERKTAPKDCNKNYCLWVID